jgi:hypothetical protein
MTTPHFSAELAVHGCCMRGQKLEPGRCPEVVHDDERRGRNKVGREVRGILGRDDDTTVRCVRLTTQVSQIRGERRRLQLFREELGSS